MGIAALDIKLKLRNSSLGSDRTLFIIAWMTIVAAVAAIAFGSFYVLLAFLAPRGVCSTVVLSKTESPSGSYTASLQRTTCDVEAFFDFGREVEYSVRVDAKPNGDFRGWSAIYPIESDAYPNFPKAPRTSWAGPTTFEVEIPTDVLRGAYERQEGSFTLVRRYVRQ